MKMQEFLKDQTSTWRNPIVDVGKTIVENYKPIIVTIAGTGIILSLTPTKELFGDEKNTPCPSPMASKLLGTSENDNKIYSAKRLTLGKKEKFFLFTIPYSRIDGRSKDPWANKETNDLATEILKKKNWVPQLVINDDTSANYSGEVREQYSKVIIEAEKKNQSLGNFSASLEDKKVSVEFKPSQDIGNNDLTLEAYVYRNHVSINPPNKNGQVHHDRILIELPLGGIDGRKVKRNKNGDIAESFDIKRLSEEFENQEGVLMVVKRRGETIGTGLFEFAKAKGIEKPTRLNWANRPENTLNLDDPNFLSKPEFVENTGYKPYNLELTDVKNLKKLKFRLHHPKDEEENFQIEAFKIKKEWKDKVDVKINNKTYEYEVTFKDAVTIDKLNLGDIYLHFLKDNQETSSGMEFAEISLTDKDGNELYWDMNNIQKYYPNQLNIKENPLDLVDKKKALINKEELDLLLSIFGSKEGDKNWKPEYDVYKEGVSKGRIDILDVLMMAKAIDEQERYIAEIKAANPDADIPELSIDTDKLAPYPKYTENTDENAKAFSEWIEKKSALKETFEKVKEVRKAGALTATY